MKIKTHILFMPKRTYGYAWYQHFYGLTKRTSYPACECGNLTSLCHPEA